MTDPHLHPARLTALAMAAALLASAAWVDRDLEAGAAPTVTDGAAPPTAVAAPGTATLISGDVIARAGAGAGDPYVLAVPRPGISYETYLEDGDWYVVPSDARDLVQAGVVDEDLFNVTYLTGHGVADGAGLPVIVEYDGAAAASRARAAAPEGTPLDSIDAVAMRVHDDDAGAFWQQLTVPGAETSARAAAPGIERVLLDRVVTADLAGSVPQVGAPAAWDAGFDGDGVTVAVLDTGIDLTHPDIAGRVTATASFVAGQAVDDGHGHGTHVAATVAGSGAGNGAPGVAPGADLLVGKVLSDQGQGLTSSIIAGMEWAVEQDADVVNMSLGSEGPGDGSDPLTQAVDELSAASETLFVVSAGNIGPTAETITAPGTAAAALTVGAVDKADDLAGFSARGPRLGDGLLKPDIVAPGVGIVAARAAGTALGTAVDALYTSANGTSMAAPHVAGAAALLAQQHPDWDGERLRAALIGSAHDLGLTVSEQGGGRLDVPAALDQPVTAEPATLSFGKVETGTPSHTVTLTNTSDAPLALDLATELTGPGGADANGLLSVAPAAVTLPAGGDVEVTVTFDAGAADLGDHSGRLVATSDDTAATVPVAVRKGLDRTVSLQVIGYDGEPFPGEAGLAARVYPLDREGLGFEAVLHTTGAATFRLPDGAYYLEVSNLLHRDRDAEQSSMFAVLPELTVAGDTEVQIDLRDLVEVDVAAPEPVTRVKGHTRMERVSALGTVYFRGFLTVANIPRTYVLPSPAPASTGTFEFSHWPTLIRSQLDLTVGDLTVYPQYANPYGGGWLGAPLLPMFEGRRQLDLVDAGDGSAAAFDGLDVAGALVLIETATGTGTPLPLREAAARAVAGGAAGIVYFDEAGVTFPRDAIGREIPAVRLNRTDGLALRAALAGGSAPAQLFGTPDSPLSYQLAFFEDGAVPADVDYRADPAELVAVDTSYHADTDAVFRQGYFVEHADQPMLPALIVPVAMFRTPAERVDYYGPADPDLVWGRIVLPSAGWLLQAWSARDVFAEPGEREESWGEGPIRPGQPVATVPADPVLYAVSREGDRIHAEAQLVDGHGRTHVGGSQKSFLEDGRHVFWTLSRDGVPVPRRAGPATSFDVPAATGRYDLTLSVRPNGTTPGSPRSDTTWSFESAHVASERSADGYGCGDDFWQAVAGDAPCAPVPVLMVDYDVDLDLNNAARVPGTHRLELGVHQLPGAPAAALDAMRAWVSVDEGVTWAELDLRDLGDERFRAMVRLPRAGDGTVSLKVDAVDAAGNRVVQTLYNAYRLDGR